MQSFNSSRRSHLFRVALPLLMVVGFLTLATSCGSEPTPTPTPSPTPTATPTPSPTPTSTPTPVPPTPTPAPVLVPIEEFEITQTTTVGELMAYLSEEEVACVSNTIGAAIFDSIQGLAFAAIPPGTADLPFECLSLETAINLQIAFVSLEAGGLSAETRNCIRAIGIENPFLFGVGEPPANPAALIGAGFQMQLCLNDEEAARLAPDANATAPPPSVLRCLEEQLGSVEDLIAVFSGQEPDPEAMLGLLAAAMECGLELEPPPGASG